jgi:hypothetical protein
MPSFIICTQVPELDFDRTCRSDEGDSRIRFLIVHVGLMKVIPELDFDRT